MLFPFLTIFLLAATLLGYEILLMRLLSIVNWSHYAHMVISLAMLGLAFSGVIIAIFPEFFKKKRKEIIFFGCLCSSLAIPLTFYLNQKLPLNYLYLLWDWHQFIYLGISYFFYGIPFMILSTIMAIFFLEFPKKTGYIYAVNLMGSGCGVILALGIMHFFPPEQYLFLISVLAVLAGICAQDFLSLKCDKRLLSLLILIIISINILISPHSLLNTISEYKDLPGLLRLPETKITYQSYSPLGLIHILEGEKIRLAPGLSLNSKQPLPPQKALTIDAASPSPIIDSINNLNSLSYFEEILPSVGYTIQTGKNSDVLIIGMGGGTNVLLSQYYQNQSTTVLEMNPLIINALKKSHGNSFEHLYPKDRVKFIIQEARGYSETSPKNFDLVVLNPSGSLSSSSAGIYAQAEDYLNTIESYQAFIKRLNPQGMIIMSQWVKTPVRNGLKLFATGFEALKKTGFKNPEQQLVLIRNWDMITLLIKQSPFNGIELQKLKAFCNQRNFDVAYFPGIKESDANQFHKLPEPIYYQGAQNIINPSQQENFFASYPFNIKPATDDKPYFSNFFRWGALLHLIKTLGTEWIPFSDLGFLTQIITLFQLLFLGILIILIPMRFLLINKINNPLSFPRRRESRNSVDPRLCEDDIYVWLYFSTLGFSYMLLEMVFIQKFILFLHHPVYASAVVIAAFLIISGVGSSLSKIILNKKIQYQIIPFVIILLAGIFYTFGLNLIFKQFGGTPIYTRFIIAFLIISPLAFFMGMPFPLGMQKIVKTGERNTGIAWGYNGFFSVIGAVSTPILAAHLGFRLVSLIGCIGYLIAMIFWMIMDAE